MNRWQAGQAKVDYIVWYRSKGGNLFGVNLLAVKLYYLQESCVFSNSIIYILVLRTKNNTLILLHYITSRKHAYVKLTPLNPTFI